MLFRSYNRTAIWNKEKDEWEILDKPRYRWTHIDDTPATEWFSELQDALDWLIEYERK